MCVEKSGTIKLAEGIYEQFNENGNAAYTMEKENETKAISEEEYYAAFEKYSNATVVGFPISLHERFTLFNTKANRIIPVVG